VNYVFISECTVDNNSWPVPTQGNLLIFEGIRKEKSEGLKG
jgi:hypothetical protein